MLEVVSILRFPPFKTWEEMAFDLWDCQGLVQQTIMQWQGALCDQSPNSTALELCNGGTFNVLEDCMVALTGAAMLASADQKPLAWNASHYLYKGNMLNLTTQQNGRYSYLHLREVLKHQSI